MQVITDFLTTILTILSSIGSFISIFIDFIKYLFTSFIESLIGLFNYLPYVLSQGFLLLISIVFVMTIIKLIHVLRS